MKLVAALIACSIVTSFVQADLNITDEQKVKLLEHHKHCSEEVKVQDDVIEKLLDGVFPTDQSFKDYLLCISKRIGFQNEAGEVQKEVIVAKLKNSIEDPSKAEEYTDRCLVKESDPAELVYKVASCLQETTPDLIFA